MAFHVTNTLPVLFLNMHLSCKSGAACRDLYSSPNSPVQDRGLYGQYDKFERAFDRVSVWYIQDSNRIFLPSRQLSSPFFLKSFLACPFYGFGISRYYSLVHESPASCI